MKPRRILIIGGVAAGTAAAAQARRSSPDAQITLIDKGSDISYSACEMPIYLAGEVSSADKIVRFTPEKFAATYNVEVLTHTEVVSIDTERRKVRITSGPGEKETSIPYDALILATGARAHVPDGLKSASKDVFVLRDLEDARQIAQTLDTQTIHHAVIVGSGYVGLDALESFHRRGIRCTLFASSGRLLKGALDVDMSDLLVSHLGDLGISIRNDRVQSLDVAPDGSIRSVHTASGEQTGCSLVLLATGTRPNTALGEKAGLKLGPAGGFQVDTHLLTSMASIWACGDVVDFTDGVTGQPLHAPLALNAFLSGRVAGQNAARGGTGRPARMKKVVRAAAVAVGGLEVAHTGWSLESAISIGLDAVAVTIQSRSAASLAPNNPLHVRLVAERTSRKLLGAQVIGKEGAVQRANVVTSHLRSGSTVDDLYDMDFIYAPRLSPLHDALLVAARALQKDL
ncbi:MAG: FAD-dependent oxidoreductase [Bacteroidetes bacterium]|nr:FAD-dependent oxidoreductase [Bacteroidota bacterium]